MQWSRCVDLLDFPTWLSRLIPRDVKECLAAWCVARPKGG